MDALNTLLLALPLSVTSGLNLYMTVLVAGLAIRLGWVEGVPEGLHVLASWPVLIVAGVLYVGQFVADKIQFVDNLWDTIHTFIRPVGAAVVAVCALSRDADPRVAIVAALVAGSAGLVSHSGKAGLRWMVNLVSPTENAKNIALSLGEDVFVAVLTLLAFTHPYVAAGLAAAVILAILLVGPKLLRWGWFAISAVAIRVRALFGQRLRPDDVPPRHAVLVDHEAPRAAAWCKAQRIRWASGRSGYLMLLADRLAFTWQKWFFLVRRWEVKRDRIQAAYFRRRWFSDTLEVHYKDGRDKPRLARFVFTRYRSPLAEDLARRLGARAAPGLGAGAAPHGPTPVGPTPGRPAPGASAAGSG